MKEDAATGRGTTYLGSGRTPRGRGPWPEALFRLDLMSTSYYHSPERTALRS